MAPEPIDYLVIRNLQTALLLMTVATGYHFDVAALAVKLDPNQDVEAIIAPEGPRPFLILEVTPETWEYVPASQVVLSLPVRIHWIADSDPTVDESFVETFFRGCADIERAIAPDHTRGGHATDTRIVTRAYDTLFGGAQVWAKVDLLIRIDRTYGQPDA